MSTNTIHVPNISGFLSVVDCVKKMDDKEMIINNIAKVRNNLFIEGNMHKVAKASEWNDFTNVNLSDFTMFSCDTENQMKELVKMDQIMRCNIKNIKLIAFLFHYEDTEKENIASKGN